MLTTPLMAFLHHLLAFTLVACLVYEFIGRSQSHLLPSKHKLAFISYQLLVVSCQLSVVSCQLSGDVH